MNENEIKDVNPNADEIQNLEAQIANIDLNTLDPNDNGKVKAQGVETKVETKVDETTVETKVETTEDPIKTELERVKGQTQGKTPKEKFEFKLKMQLAQAKEMGIDIKELGFTAPETNDEDKPITRKDLEDAIRNVKPSSKSATELAMAIENDAERELHLYYIDNKVNPNLSEEEKFQTAKDMVNSIKLKNHVTLNEVKPQAQTHSTAHSIQPEKKENVDAHRLTLEEDMLFRDAQVRGISLTKEEILKMR